MRHEDPPLSDVGRQQLAAVAKHTQKLAKRTGCAKGKYKVSLATRISLRVACLPVRCDRFRDARRLARMCTA